MTIPLVILRPEPGLGDSLSAARDAGLTAIACPLTTLEPVDWTVPDPAGFDALLLTSAQAPGMAGEGLAALAGLPVLAVGQRTAAAARAAGLTVERVGMAGIDALLAEAGSGRRLLHLCTAGHHQPTVPADIVHLPVYRAMAVAAEVPIDGPHVYMVHSNRAGAMLAVKVPRDRRGDKIVVAISDAVAASVGDGWRMVRVAAQPHDAAMLSMARHFCQS